MAEADGIWIAAMFAANAQLEICARLSSTFRRNANKFSHAVAIDGNERIACNQTFREIFGEECARVVAADTECCLRQIVGAEGEELRALGDFTSAQGGARQFDHGTDEVSRRSASFGRN